MLGRRPFFGGVVLLVAGVSGALAAVFTEHDSTQPRGAPLVNAFNDHGQLLDPIVDGFRAPAFRARAQSEIYRDWAGMIMANASRDPAFYATLSVANRDLIKYINSLPGKPRDIKTPLGKFLADQRLDFDISRDRKTKKLEPEELLPVVADLCLRCHSPVGWLEGHSEPRDSNRPFLKGQFWGAALLQNPIDANTGQPREVNQKEESEAQMDGLQCDFCHRAKDNFKRISNYDKKSRMANGNGGYFVARTDPFEVEVEPKFDFQKTGEFCGTCHDVTNPIIKTKTRVNGAVPDMFHPIERTYTEWFWSDYRNEQTCQDCHKPMKFLGAQTWLIFPGLDRLWGDVDEKWRKPPFNYQVPLRSEAYQVALIRNHSFVAEQAASVGFVDTPTTVSQGKPVTVKVKVINKAGHRLPTGYAEGRQMWIHIRVADASGSVIFEDGVLDGKGALVRTPETKVYEQKTLAIDYPTTVIAADDQEFHFVLMNFIEKDNRIPPKGYNKAAYTADGAFIITRDPKDTDYADGQFWDVTPYTFRVPPDAQGDIQLTATLNYQTFNREYIEFLREHDKEPTQRFGGRARNLPSGPFVNFRTWGEALHQIWGDAGMGPPVVMGQARQTLRLSR